jgi:hypothetical protein
MDIEVHVLSSISRRFLELLGKLDQLMPLLQTLEIHEVITAQAVDMQRAGLKRQVRDIANGARNFAIGLRRRMNALDARGVDADRDTVPVHREPASADPLSAPGSEIAADLVEAPAPSTEATADAPVSVEQ